MADPNPETTTPDGSTPDTTTPDGGVPDETTSGGTAPDSSTSDSSTSDASAPDAPAIDATTPDASAPDSSTPDPSTQDASTPDATIDTNAQNLQDAGTDANTNAGPENVGDPAPCPVENSGGGLPPGGAPPQQPGALIVTVTNSADGTIIQGATVNVSSPSGSASSVSDDAGKATFNPLSPDSYQVSASKTGFTPVSSVNANVPPGSVNSPVAAQVQLTPIVCWPADYDKEISIASSYGRYCHKYKPDGTEYTTSELPILKLRAKIYAPVKTGVNITVEVRIRAEAQTGATATDVSAAKTKLESGVNTYWNLRFNLTASDPQCGSKSFPVEYKTVWVTSGEHYVMNVYDTWPREGEGNGVVSVQRSTTPWIFAHEFGHCIGLPDEYSTLGTADSVRYTKPDGTLDAQLTAPALKPTTDPDASIMSSYGNTTRFSRHCWNIAIEVQDLLTSQIGRTITCTIA